MLVACVWYRAHFGARCMARFIFCFFKKSKIEPLQPKVVKNESCVETYLYILYIGAHVLTNNSNKCNASLLHLHYTLQEGWKILAVFHQEPHKHLSTAVHTECSRSFFLPGTLTEWGGKRIIRLKLKVQGYFLKTEVVRTVQNSKEDKIGCISNKRRMCTIYTSKLKGHDASTDLHWGLI